MKEALQDDVEGVARLFVKDEDHDGQIVTGIAEQIRAKMEEYTDTTTGIGYVLIENYNGIISQIDDKITNEERRIALVRTRLEEKFARLEKVLGELDGQSKYIESQIDELPSIGG